MKNGLRADFLLTSYYVYQRRNLKAASLISFSEGFVLGVMAAFEITCIAGPIILDRLSLNRITQRFRIVLTKRVLSRRHPGLLVHYGAHTLRVSPI